MTANDADMCAAATDAGVVTELGGGEGGRKEEERDVRGRGRGGEMDRGEKGSTTDRTTTKTTTTTMNERRAKLGRIAPPPPRLERSGNFLAGSVYGDMRNKS